MNQLSIFYFKDQILLPHFNGVHQVVWLWEMPSLSPWLSIRVSNFVGAKLSSFVDLSKLSNLIVLAMCGSVHGAFVLSLTLLSNSSLV